MNYKIAQFILTPPQRGQSTLEIYVAQPDASKEALAGKLFALFDIESPKSSSLKIISFLTAALSHDYYQNEKLILKERVNTIKVEHIFESALARTNKKLAEFLQTEKIKFDPGIMNITIGVIYNDSLHFANLGKNKALLLYKGKSGEAAKYKLADITEQTGAAETKKPSGAVKFFSNVISGNLPRGGYFIFSSETFSEYLSAKQIIDIITTLPPAGAAEQIKNMLGKINAYVPFLGIIIKNTLDPETVEVKAREPIVSTKSSIESLNITEEKTEKLLTPSGLINAKKWPLVLNGLVSRLTFKKMRKSGGQAASLKDKIFIKRKAVWLPGAKILNLLKNFLIYTIGFFIYFFKTITDKQAMADAGNNLILKVKNFRRHFRVLLLKTLLWYKSLNKVGKILFSAFLVCLLIFFVSLGYENIKNRAEKKQAVVNNTLAAIEQKQNQVDASLLYGNEAGAKELLKEINDLLKQMPRSNQGEQDQYNKLAAKYQTQIEKISHAIRVNPVELANFVNLNPGAKPQSIVLAREKIYAADAAQAAIYSIDLKNKLTTSLNLGGQKMSRLGFPSLDKDNNIYYFGPDKALVLDTKNAKLSGLNLSRNLNLDKAAGLEQYNGRFYSVDAAAGQIYRFNKSGDTLASPSPWLAGKEDLANVISLDIDGDIYLLKGNGEISKYTKGKKRDFPQATVEPPLAQASKVIVSPSENYIYVLEPAGKRLVVFDKSGKFINQYVSDALNSLKDFQVDETSKKIYFLNNTAVYSIDMVK
ncbi:MAG: hypothetical protein PHS62_01485 [Patescibacteria group bacterium]|nr:hypothetical protein [Patescibacteria group bacterium]